MKTRHVIALVSIIFLLILGICGGSVWIVFKDWGSYEPSEYPLQQAQAMLDSIAIRTAEPDITPEPWEIVPPQCKDLLQKHMLQNNNQYTLTVAKIMGDYGTSVPGTGADEIILHVTFPDGSRVQLYFYAATLDECRELTG
jgi:hypothetical protein